MAQGRIEAKQTAVDDQGWTFDVTVTDESGSSNHQVTVSRDFLKRITQKASVHPTPKQVVTAIFRFLLRREPKESIMAQFDAETPQKYFNDYLDQLPKML